jgi:hypothetical protein
MEAGNSRTPRDGARALTIGSGSAFDCGISRSRGELSSLRAAAYRDGEETSTVSGGAVCGPGLLDGGRVQSSIARVLASRCVIETTTSPA